MKGVELTISTIIIIVLGLIILLAFGYLILMGRGQVDVIQYQAALRNCCGDRSIYDCTDTVSYSTIQCKVPWSEDTISMQELIEQAGLDINNQDSIRSFCFC